MIYILLGCLLAGSLFGLKKTFYERTDIPYHYLKSLGQLGMQSNAPHMRLKQMVIKMIGVIQGKRNIWRKEYLDQLDENLKRSGMGESSIEFKVKQYIVPIFILVLGFSIGHMLTQKGIAYAIQILSVIAAYAAFQVPVQEMNKRLAAKRDCILLELPRFIRTIRFSPDHKPMIFIIKDYLKVARGGLKYDFEMIISDMETNFTEHEALMRFSKRTGIIEVRELCSAINLLEGGSRSDAKMVLLLIENKLIEETRRIMQSEMNKRPERLLWVNEVLLFLLGFLFIVPVGLSVWESMRQLLI